jgi:hypothetical protein
MIGKKNTFLHSDEQLAYNQSEKISAVKTSNSYNEKFSQINFYIQPLSYNSHLKILTYDLDFEFEKNPERIANLQVIPNWMYKFISF